MYNFSEQVIIVTGAGRGLGRAYSLALAARGARVVAIDNGCDIAGCGRNSAYIEDLDEMVHDMGAELIGHCEDVTDYEVMQRIVDETVTRFGRIDGLICNAGLILPQQGILDSLDCYRRQMEINHFASISLVQQVLPHMTQANCGNIIITGGLTPAYGDKRLMGFAAAVAANVGFVRCMAVELEQTGVGIKMLVPSNYSRQSEQLELPYSFENMTPDMVAPGMLYLLSSESPNGQIISAGGGYYSIMEVGESDGFMLDPSMQRPQEVAKAMKRLNETRPEGKFKTFVQRMNHVIKLLMVKRT